MKGLSRRKVAYIVVEMMLQTYIQAPWKLNYEVISQMPLK